MPIDIEIIAAVSLRLIVSTSAQIDPIHSSPAMLSGTSFDLSMSNTVFAAGSQIVR